MPSKLSLFFTNTVLFCCSLIYAWFRSLWPGQTPAGVDLERGCVQAQEHVRPEDPLTPPPKFRPPRPRRSFDVDLEAALDISYEVQVQEERILSPRIIPSVASFTSSSFIVDLEKDDLCPEQDTGPLPCPKLMLTQPDADDVGDNCGLNAAPEHDEDNGYLSPSHRPVLLKTEEQLQAEEQERERQLKQEQCEAQAQARFESSNNELTNSKRHGLVVASPSAEEALIQEVNRFSESADAPPSPPEREILPVEVGALTPYPSIESIPTISPHYWPLYVPPSSYQSSTNTSLSLPIPTSDTSPASPSKSSPSSQPPPLPLPPCPEVKNSDEIKSDVVMQLEADDVKLKERHRHRKQKRKSKAHREQEQDEPLPLPLPSSARVPPCKRPLKHYRSNARCILVPITNLQGSARRRPSHTEIEEILRYEEPKKVEKKRPTSTVWFSSKHTFAQEQTQADSSRPGLESQSIPPTRRRRAPKREAPALSKEVIHEDEKEAELDDDTTRVASAIMNAFKDMREEAYRDNGSSARELISRDTVIVGETSEDAVEDGERLLAEAPDLENFDMSVFYKVNPSFRLPTPDPSFLFGSSSPPPFCRSDSGHIVPPPPKESSPPPQPEDYPLQNPCLSVDVALRPISPVSSRDSVTAVMDDSEYDDIEAILQGLEDVASTVRTLRPLKLPQTLQAAKQQVIAPVVSFASPVSCTSPVPTSAPQPDDHNPDEPLADDNCSTRSTVGDGDHWSDVFELDQYSS